MAQAAQHADTGVLPNFCSDETLLRVLTFAILFALVVTLLRGLESNPLINAGLVLLFVTWVAMSSLLLLCLIQGWLRRRRTVWQVMLPPLVAVLNTGLVHLAAGYFELADPSHRPGVLGVAILMSLIAMHYLYLISAWKDETRHVARAQEQALRARVRPHFLFNSMNTIAGLCRTDPAKAEQITLDLADLFRATFSMESTHPLSAELELGRSYLAIEKSRFGHRLQLEWDTAETKDAALEVPSLILQPLVENAIQHGIAPCPTGGHVWVHSRYKDHSIVVTIGNTIAGDSSTGTHTAGEEVRARLKHAFGDRASVREDRTDQHFEIRVTLPYQRATDRESQ